MRIEQLKCLVDVAETKSMSKTAERLFVSPQAVSKSVKQLEQELDATLLVRTSGGVMLTKVGEEIVNHAKQMLAEEQQITQLINRHKQQEQVEDAILVRICSTSVIVNMVLPSILAKFVTAQVKIIPRIHMVETIEDVMKQLATGAYDVGLVTYNEEELFRLFAPYQNVLELELLARDKLLAVMDSHQYQPGQTVFTPMDRKEQFWTMYSVMPIATYEKEGQSTHVLCSNDSEFHRAMIKEAGAYVLMPGLAYQQFFKGKSYVAMEFEDAVDLKLMHGMLYRKDASEQLRMFAALIRVGLQ